MTTTRTSSLAATPAALLDAAFEAAAISESASVGLPLLAQARRNLAAEFNGTLPAGLLGALPGDRADAAANTARRFQMLLGSGLSGPHVLRAAASHLGRKVPGDTEASQLSRVLDRSFWLKHYARLARQRDEFAFIKSG